MLQGTPTQKLRQMLTLQCRSEVVAIAGDGVTDGNALRPADVGATTGLRGTDVAREAARC